VNRELARKVADAILYEGYMLYPYRPSAIKNRQRWTFGILYPPAYQEVNTGTERSTMHSECLLKTAGEATVQVELRFLHLIARQVLEQVDGNMKPVVSLTVDGQKFETWDDGIERCIEFECSSRQQRFKFNFPGNCYAESLRDHAGAVLGSITRTQRQVSGSVLVSSEPLPGGIVKLAIDVGNESPLAADALDRNSALLSSLLSAHSILTIRGGEFISLLDPPDQLGEAVSNCRNVGNFPVLVGNEGERDMLLCSPILLYDYPQIAPESGGDFYDSTEMDEMLTLRVMTLTDEEKDEMRRADDHVRDLLQRTEQSARDQLMRTHGTIRSMRPVNEP
jgi:hydrogenase maturation protease